MPWKFEQNPRRNEKDLEVSRSVWTKKRKNNSNLKQFNNKKGLSLETEDLHNLNQYKNIIKRSFDNL